jgi:hypothetical protein
MAHGDKKWIVDFSGKLKKSNDRTKKDYYGELKWWKSWKRESNKENFCPQCKHFAKPIQEEQDRIRKINRSIHDAFKKQYPKYADYDVVMRLSDFETWGDYFIERNKRNVARTKDFEKFQRDYPIKREEPWNYDSRSYLCDKHRNWDDQQHSMWQEMYPHWHKIQGWRKRDDWRKYRAKVKQAMKDAKDADFDAYDDIPAYKKNWLD